MAIFIVRSVMNRKICQNAIQASYALPQSRHVPWDFYAVDVLGLGIPTE